MWSASLHELHNTHDELLAELVAPPRGYYSSIEHNRQQHVSGTTNSQRGPAVSVVQLPGLRSVQQRVVVDSGTSSAA